MLRILLGAFLLQLMALIIIGMITTVSAQQVVRVRYGYFPEARPIHALCARGWMDLFVPGVNGGTIYEVACYPQTSGNFVASRLDSGQLDIALLGSTPMAQAAARGIDIKVVYISHYMGSSQGIYVRPDDSERNYTGIENPFELEGRTIGVPFGSTMHYQILFLLDLFGLSGKVKLLNLSPTEIIAAWDNDQIDAAGCWGAARDHLFGLNDAGHSSKPPAYTLMSAGVLSDWGRPTYVVAAATRTFAKAHPAFMTHIVGMLSRINDSYLDRLGEVDSLNVLRWDGQQPAGISYVPSMVDTLMKAGEIPASPSQELVNSQRRALDEFIQQSATEQTSCQYLGPSPGTCMSPTLQHVATRQTAEFLLDQKLISSLGPLEEMGDLDNCEDLSTLCGGDILDGQYLADSLVPCQDCLPLGVYARDGHYAGNTNLLLRFEELDSLNNRSSFAVNEIGRAPAGQVSAGDSTCVSSEAALVDNWSSEVTGSFGDGANAEQGKSYSDNLNCVWEIRGVDCDDANSTCTDIVELRFEKLRVWSADYVRVYSDPNFECKPTGHFNVLLAQLSGVHENDNDLLSSVPPIRAVGCMLVVFSSDSNQERSYGDMQNKGDGFLVSYDRQNVGCLDSSDCNGFPCGSQGLCECGGRSWGADCSLSKYCLGTSRVALGGGGERQELKSSSDLLAADLNVDFLADASSLDASIAYPNSVDCTFVVAVPRGERFVEVSVFYDLEPTFDLLRLQTGSVSSDGVPNLYTVLSGAHYSLGNRQEYGRSEVVVQHFDGGPEDYTTPEVYLVPTDEFGIVSLRFTTDDRGRRRGFVASVRAVGDVPNESGLCSVPGESGSNCEVSHCIAQNQLQGAAMHAPGPYVLGRVISQTSGSPVPAMPWAPDGGCIWTLLEGSSVLENVVALRLVFNSPLALESHPVADVGDKLIIRTNRPNQEKNFELFMEQCDSDEMCSFPWQTGICGDDNNCIVQTSIEVDARNITGATARLVTDRSDGGRVYSGLDFDALLVAECPNDDDAHCEAVGGQCIDGYCYCENNMPCSCSCKGDPPTSTSLKIGLTVGIVSSVAVVFLAFFLCYRRRKIVKSRKQKAALEAKDAELKAFLETIVGMRTANRDYIPNVSLATGVEMAPLSYAGVSPVPPPTSDIQWCWKETNGEWMNKHDRYEIVGDPADCWIKYDNESNAALEAAYLEQGMIGQFSPLPGYDVDFQTMVQTKRATGFQRSVQRLVISTPSKKDDRKIDLDKTQVGERLPKDLLSEPQMVLVTGDVIQISSQRPDGWAFGTKLHHADEALARQLVLAATNGIDNDEDANVLTDTGWFELDATCVPSSDDLAMLHTSVGDTGALDPPSYWDPVVDPTIVQHVLLDLHDDESQAVVDAFLSTLKPPQCRKKAKVLKVERIQNLCMWQTYVVKRQTICYRETSKQAPSDETTAGPAMLELKALERFERRWLWHGTNSEVMDKILQQGFNRSFCGKNATMYGKGVYFARDASYSAYPGYAVPDANGRQYMMACRVVVGEYCKGKTDALTPDVRDVSSNALYDSTVGLLSGDNMSNPSIYVTYHDAQAYPEYLITFKLH